MVEYYKLIALLFFVPILLYRISNLLYWIQIKEYRFDRFYVFITSREGRRLLGFRNWLMEVFFASFILIQDYLIFLFIIYLLYEYSQIIISVREGEIKKPIITQRIYLILSTIILFLIYSLVQHDNFFIQILLLNFLSLLGICFGVAWTVLVVKQIKKRETESARRQLQKVKPIVIGITGSYGKTSTKEFLTTILSSQYPTIGSHKNENTEFGLIRLIINGLKRNTKYLVTEMGAYKKGEIKAICQIVKPDIGILTGIEPQHLALFKKFEYIKQAKFELMESLPKHGMAFFNYSNKYCRKLAQKAAKLPSNLKIFGYLLKESDKLVSADCEAQIIKETIQGIYFQIKLKDRKENFFAPLHGKHFIENLTGAILISYKLGIQLEKIKTVCANLQTLPGTMELIYLRNKSYVVNDSYNTTPQGFKSALSYLESFKGYKKIIFTPGIIELGLESFKIHREIGKLLRKTDNIFLTNPEFKNDIQTGLAGYRNKLTIVSRNFNFEKKLLKNLMARYRIVILIEGRIPQKIMDILLKI